MGRWLDVYCGGRADTASQPKRTHSGMHQHSESSRRPIELRLLPIGWFVGLVGECVCVRLPLRFPFANFSRPRAAQWKTRTLALVFTFPCRGAHTRRRRRRRRRTQNWYVRPVRNAETLANSRRHTLSSAAATKCTGDDGPRWAQQATAWQRDKQRRRPNGGTRALCTESCQSVCRMVAKICLCCVRACVCACVRRRAKNQAPPPVGLCHCSLIGARRAGSAILLARSLLLSRSRSRLSARRRPCATIWPHNGRHSSTGPRAQCAIVERTAAELGRASCRSLCARSGRACARFWGTVACAGGGGGGLAAAGAAAIGAATVWARARAPPATARRPATRRRRFAAGAHALLWAAHTHWRPRRRRQWHTHKSSRSRPRYAGPPPLFFPPERGRVHVAARPSRTLCAPPPRPC